MEQSWSLMGFWSLTLNFELRRIVQIFHSLGLWWENEGCGQDFSFFPLNISICEDHWSSLDKPPVYSLAILDRAWFRILSCDFGQRHTSSLSFLPHVKLAIIQWVIRNGSKRNGGVLGEELLGSFECLWGTRCLPLWGTRGLPPWGTGGLPPPLLWRSVPFARTSSTAAAARILTWKASQFYHLVLTTIF